MGRGGERIPDGQLPEEIDGHVATSSATMVRPDGAGGSIQTNYTHSDMAPLGGSAAPAQRHLPGKKAGQAEPIAETRGDSGRQRAAHHAAGPAPAANEAVGASK
jgi:hypothetical protein